MPPKLRTVAIPTLILALALLALPAAALADGLVLDAYAWPTSVAQGDTVRLYVSCSEPTYDVEIYRDGGTYDLHASYPSLPGNVQAVPESAFAKGCDWEPSVVVPIPESWPSGVYVAEIQIPDTTQYAIFVVREDQPGSTARILFQTSLTTWAAYNAWGGKSLYSHNSTDSVRSYFSSLRRPFDDWQGRGVWPRWERKMAGFLERFGFDVEYCTGVDTHFLPQLENFYDLYIITGHDEYWSYEMRNNIEGRIARGQSVAIFSGNTSWWQIRIDSPDVITCYKSKFLDPMNGVANHLVTVNWHDDPVFRPENYMTGLSFRNGGYHNWGGWYPDTLGYGDYEVMRSDHWVFDGTGLQNGDEFGGIDGIVGYETDGALFKMIGGLPFVTGLDGSPLNYTILATAPASHGTATMGFYEGPGAVFNAATTGWADGLGNDPTPDPIIQRITLNVVHELLQRVVSVPPTGPGAHPPSLRLSISPNPARGSALIRWDAEATGAYPRISIYDVRGALVARTGEATPASGRAVWDGRDEAGRPAPAGLYFAVVEGENMRGTGRIIVVR